MVRSTWSANFMLKLRNFTSFGKIMCCGCARSQINWKSGDLIFTTWKIWTFAKLLAFKCWNPSPEAGHRIRRMDCNFGIRIQSFKVSNYGFFSSEGINNWLSPCVWFMIWICRSCWNSKVEVDMSGSEHGFRQNNDSRHCHDESWRHSYKLHQFHQFHGLYLYRNRTLLRLFSKFPFLSPLFHRLFLIRRYCMVNGSKSFQLGSYGLTALQDKVMWDLGDLIWNHSLQVEVLE